MRTVIRFFILFMLITTADALSAEKGLVVKNVRYFSYSAFTRIVLEVESASPYVLNKTADGKGLMFAAYNMPLEIQSHLPIIKDGVVRGLESVQDAGRNTIIVRLDAAAGEIKDFVLHSPDRIVLDIARGIAPASSASSVQGKKMITVVLDPGHGGRETGILTAQSMEKNFTLNVALSVKKNLSRNPRFRVLLTREKDQLLSLEERVVASNASEAQFFISIHGTTSAAAQVYLQDFFDDTPVQAIKPAGGDFLGFEIGSEQQQMLWGRQQAAHVRESGMLGRSIATQLVGKDTAEPVQAPLAVLKAADAAAVLVECSMMQDGQKAAEAIAEGIERYVKQGK